MILGLVGDILAEPFGRKEVLGCLYASEFHLSHDQRIEGLVEYVKLDHEGVLIGWLGSSFDHLGMVKGYEISLLGYDIAVSFCKKVIISFRCEREIGLLSLHKSGSLVGEIEVVILPADPDYGIGAQICLLYTVKRITFKVIRYLVYKLAAAVCSCVADKRMGELIGDLGACFSLVLALNGTGGLILFVSVYSLMKTVVQ